MNTMIKILLGFVYLGIIGCANQGYNGEYMVSDTAAVTVKHGPNITRDEKYEDPLYYNNNAFDNLYFN